MQFNGRNGEIKSGARSPVTRHTSLIVTRGSRAAERAELSLHRRRCHGHFPFHAQSQFNPRNSDSLFEMNEMNEYFLNLAF